MPRPTWGTVVGIIFIIIAIFGIFSAIQDINVRKLSALVNMTMDEMASDALEDTTPPDSSDLKILGMLGDSIVIDSTGTVDMTSTLKAFTKISEYRMVWMIRLAYVSIGLSLFFLLSGIFLFKKSKFTIPISLTTLAIAIAFGIFKIMIYAADMETGKMISFGENLSIYFGIFIYILLLITVMVCDKTYYQGEKERI